MSLNKVKISFFVRLLFHHLNEKRKLKIINYNKYIQKLLGINIINYKIFYGKYIEYESDGKAREYYYYNDNLVYEGEYLNGKGKEYDEFEENIILFEGEYFNGKRNGKGKEYHFDSKNSKFEGEYLKGKKWNGKGYDIDGNILYELKDGNGFIREYNNYFSLEFEGEYKNGEKNGKGKEYYENIIIFDGEYLNGKKWNGKLFDVNSNIVCVLRNGKGILKEYNKDNILIKEEKYLNGELNGKVRKFNDEGRLIFEGEYLDDIINGKVK